MTPKRLFWRRLLSEWRLKRTAWSTTIDWTVALYIIIPGLIIATVSYIRLWNQLPTWAVGLPTAIPLLLISLYTWTGTIRLFLEEPDQLFLLQHREWTLQIMSCGIGYSAVCSLLTTFFVLFPACNLFGSESGADHHVEFTAEALSWSNKMILGL
jgi:ABC-2 type transport system permease protein